MLKITYFRNSLKSEVVKLNGESEQTEMNVIRAKANS